jgi:uncharacterized protein with ParB-like and HNH nuclease domain
MVRNEVGRREGLKMEITPDKLKLIDLVEDAYRGKLCRPNFQRDFVWPRDQVADLVRSVLRGYFRFLAAAAI